MAPWRFFSQLARAARRSPATSGWTFLSPRAAALRRKTTTSAAFRRWRFEWLGRAECSCAQIGEAGCELPLQPGVCAPIPTVLCRRPCAESSRCFGGELECVDGVCQPESRGLCAECASPSDCDSGVCARNENTGESFCGPRCPSSGEGRIVCPELMSCRRLDGDPFTFLSF